MRGLKHQLGNWYSQGPYILWCGKAKMPNMALACQVCAALQVEIGRAGAQNQRADAGEGMLRWRVAATTGQTAQELVN
jgi:hypothetical protein